MPLAARKSSSLVLSSLAQAHRSSTTSDAQHAGGALGDAAKEHRAGAGYEPDVMAILSSRHIATLPSLVALPARQGDGDHCPGAEPPSTRRRAHNERSRAGKELGEVWAYREGRRSL